VVDELLLVVCSVLLALSMTRKRKRERTPLFEDLSPQARQGIGAVFFAVLGIFFALSSMGFAGVMGGWTHQSLSYLFGYGFVLAPLVCLLYVITLLRPRHDTGTTSVARLLGIGLLFTSILGLFALWNGSMGGLLGWLLERPLTSLFGSIASGIAMVGLLAVSIFLTFNTGISIPLRSPEEKRKLKPALPPEEDHDVDIPVTTTAQKAEKLEPEHDDEDDTPRKTLTEKVFGAVGAQPPAEFMVTSFSGTYAPPPLTLLERDKGKGKSGDVKANANIIKRTLEKFGIEVEMDEVTIGPSITRYALKPAEGVRIAKIVSLQSNLELALAASPLRI
jgi:DNA segregation ATPase FtsK/SpoIIIE, S-DNA-T family